MRVVVTYDTNHGSAKRVADNLAAKLGTRSINVGTPFEAEDVSIYDAIVLVFGFRGPYTAQLTKLFLQRMKDKLKCKHVILIGEGLFSEKEFPVVAGQIKDLIKCASFNTYFIKGQLRVDTLTPEEQALLGTFSKLTGMKITDMGELKDEAIEELTNEVVNKLDTMEPVIDEAPTKKWICSICGYVHEGDEPPEKCPTCGQPKEVFRLTIKCQDKIQ